MKRLVVAAVVALLIAASYPSATALSRPEAKLLHLTNHARIVRGLHALTPGWRLTVAARQQARAIGTSDSLFHSHGACSYWGENVGVTSAGPWALHQAFMHSPLHRANILDRRFRRIGIGAFRIDGALWVAVEFCA